MKIAGLLLLPAGWLLVIAAVLLLHPSAAEGSFVLTGLAVEVLALALLFRSHLAPRRRHE